MTNMLTNLNKNLYQNFKAKFSNCVTNTLNKTNSIQNNSVNSGNKHNILDYNKCIEIEQLLYDSLQNVAGMYIPEGAWQTQPKQAQWLKIIETTENILLSYQSNNTIMSDKTMANNIIANNDSDNNNPARMLRILFIWMQAKIAYSSMHSNLMSTNLMSAQGNHKSNGIIYTFNSQACLETILECMLEARSFIHMIKPKADKEDTEQYSDIKYALEKADIEISNLLKNLSLLPNSTFTFNDYLRAQNILQKSLRTDNPAKFVQNELAENKQLDWYLAEKDAQHMNNIQNEEYKKEQSVKEILINNIMQNNLFEMTLNEDCELQPIDLEEDQVKQDRLKQDQLAQDQLVNTYSESHHIKSYTGKTISQILELIKADKQTKDQAEYESDNNDMWNTNSFGDSFGDALAQKNIIHDTHSSQIDRNMDRNMDENMDGQMDLKKDGQIAGMNLNSTTLTRQQAYNQLRKIAAFLIQNEPHAFTGYILQQLSALENKSLAEVFEAIPNLQHYLKN